MKKKEITTIRSMLSDTPERIAIRYKVDPSELIRINPELVPNRIIQIGSVIILPEQLQKKTKKKETKKKEGGRRNANNIIQ